MNIDHTKGNEIRPQIERTAMRGFLEALKRQALPPSFCGIRWDVSFDDVDTDAMLKRLGDRGIISPLVLAERMLAGLDIESEARSLKLTTEQTYALHAAAVEALTPEERASMEAHLGAPRGKGLLPPDHPAIAPILQAIGIDKRQVTEKVIQRWIDLDRSWLFLPRGPLRAVDHRPKLGLARDQGGRLTCSAFASTVVAEALEYLRDRRPGPRDFSEEFLWWYSKNGQLNSAGGYDCRVALDHYAKNGVPDEKLLPYSGIGMSYNWAHIPIPDDAIDRAFDYRQPPLATLAEGDIGAAKAVIKSGRCVAFAALNSDDEAEKEWHTEAGLISFPNPLDLHGAGGIHCATIIGYIDRDDLPAHFEGGYFIVRNSWGGANSSNHLMGPEYGGHLLMPYGWYRRYTGGPATLGSDTDPTETAGVRQWQAEYYANTSLHGVPARIEPLLDVDFNWGTTGGPLPSLDEFSARFTQIRRLRPGWYRFTLQGDDGVRLWVDDRLVINQWKEQPSTAYTAEHYVTGGDHILRVEYFEARGSANVQLQIQEIEFRYELFTNTDLAGTPAATFNDTMTDLEWRHAPPVDTSSAYGQFSLRATGSKHFAAGTYTFHAQHSGGCRMWVDDNLVLDDWSGANGNGEPVTLTAGVHSVRVEFAHRTVIPAADAKAYYRAILAFDWSDAAWTGRVHLDNARQELWPRVSHTDGSIYEAFRVQVLTGDPVLTHNYSVPAPAGTVYGASDGPSSRLNFRNAASFVQGVAGADGIEERLPFSSAIFTRRLYVPRDGRYQVKLESAEVTRVCIDGNKVLDRLYLADSFVSEIMLHAGVHDLTIECADAGGDRNFDFALEPATWSVNYFTGTNLDSLHSHGDVPGAEFIIVDRPEALPASGWSARATRTLLLGVGRYRIIVRADDGVRVKASGNLVINAWKNQASTTYTAVLEHSGGPVDFEIEYYHDGEGGAELSFELKPDGFIGEYYKGTRLDRLADSDDLAVRHPPHAYRFEPAIDFDWGGTGRLARVGSDQFSARWWGTIELPVGRWKFKVTSDDGVRLFLDGRLLIDRWVDQPATIREAIVDLPAGRRALRLEYYERTGNAVCKLELERLFGAGESIPI